MEKRDQHSEEKRIAGIELIVLPELSPGNIRQIRAATAAMLTDIHMAVGHALEREHFDDTKRRALENAEHELFEFWGDLIAFDLEDNNFSAEEYRLNFELILEEIPTKVFEAMLILGRAIPKVQQLFTEIPQYTSGYNLIFLAFQRALHGIIGRNGISLEKVERRKKRIARLVDATVSHGDALTKEKQPHPIEISEVTLDKITAASAELHELIRSRKDSLPKDVHKDVEVVLDFLSFCSNPAEGLRQEGERRRFYEKMARFLENPRDLHFGEIPQEVCDAAARLQMEDPTLNLAFWGYQTGFRERASALIGPDGKPLKVLGNPFPYNPFNIAAHNTREREKRDEAKQHELYRYDAFYRIVEEGPTAIEIINAHMLAEIERALRAERNKPGWLRRTAVKALDSILNAVESQIEALEFAQPLDVFFRERNKARREERDRKTIEKWKQRLANPPQNYLEIHDFLVQMCRSINDSFRLIKILEADNTIYDLFRSAIEDYISRVDPAQHVDWGQVRVFHLDYLDDEASFRPNIPRYQMNTLEKIKKAWLERYYYPKSLHSVVEKEKYKVAQVLDTKVKGEKTPVIGMQILPDGRIVFRKRKTIEIFNINELLYRKGEFQKTTIRGKEIPEKDLHRVSHIQILPDNLQIIDGYCVCGYSGLSAHESEYWKPFPQDFAEAGFVADNFTHLELLPNGDRIGVRDGNVLFRVYKDGKWEKVTANGNVSDINTSPDGKFIAAVCNGELVTWDRGGNHLVERMPLGEYERNTKPFPKYIFFKWIQCQRLFQILPNVKRPNLEHKQFLFKNMKGGISVLHYQEEEPQTSELEIIPANEEYGDYTTACMEPNGQIFVGTSKGKVLVFNGEDVKR